jgi:hypothetical protein
MNSNKGKEVDKHYHEQQHRASHEHDDLEGSEDDDSDQMMPGAIKIPGIEGSKEYGMDHPIIESEQSHGHIVSAIPVQEELDEGEKEKIRLEAERDVERRLAQGGEFQIAGEREYDDSQQQEKKKKRMYILLGVVCMVILIVVIVVVVVTVGGNNDKDTNQIQRSSPTPPTNTFAPTLAGTVLWDAPTGEPVDECNGALELDPTNEKQTKRGTTVGAQTDLTGGLESGDLCKNGKGIWYSLEGDSRMWLASTCNNTRIDTQISIYKGSCGSLECVVYNDQQCGGRDQSRVAFLAESGSKYYVLVHGGSFRNAAGNFQLEVAVIPKNDSPDNAQEVGRKSQTFSSTTGAEAIENALGDLLGAGVWFRTTFPPGVAYLVHLDTRITGFIGEIAILTFTDPNASSDISLIVTSDFADSHEIIEASDVDRVYFIFVRAKEGERNGDFELVVGPQETQPPLRLPSNTDCNVADSIFPGESVASNTRLLTENASNRIEISCGNQVFTTSPGYWYQFLYFAAAVEGFYVTVIPLTFSTCNNQTDFDTQISIFRGDCSNLECVDGNDQGPSSCGDKSTVSILAEAGVKYFIYVHGYGDRGGRYLLTVEQEQADLNVGTECGNATEIEPDGTSTLGSTENLGAPLTRSCFGSNMEPSVGAWYHVVGTGEAMIASTCHPSTDFGAMISVYSAAATAASEDCSSLVCVEDAAYYPCGVLVGQTAVSWNTVNQQDYYIFVHEELSDADLGFGGGYFVLSVDTVAENDSCENAVRILGSIASPDVQKTFGSTRGSTIGVGAQGCTGDGGRGLWYSVEGRTAGSSNNRTVSTCSEYTDFDTRVSVFVSDDDCSSLECISLDAMLLLPVSNLCGVDATVSWISTPGQRYLILVQGFSESDFGNFELQSWTSLVVI